MNRFLSVLLSIMFFTTSVILIYANAAPSYWEAYPYSEVLTVDEDCPIIVNSERLTFNFSEDYEYGHSYAPVARVMANYEMTNPTKETLSVQMAFPLVASLEYFSPENMTIRVDGEAVPYDIFIDPNNADIGTGEGFSYGDVGDISKKEISLDGFDLNARTKRYRFKVINNSAEGVDLKINFKVDPKKTMLITSGFNAASYSSDKGSSISSRIQSQDDMEILVLGNEPEFTYGVYTNDNEKISSESYCIEVIKDTVIPKEYLLNGLREDLSEDTIDIISHTQLLKPYEYRILQDSQMTGFVMLDDVLSSTYIDRIITLVYTVDFARDESRQISISYLTSGIMDRRDTVLPKYSYTYLLSPAKNWAGFSNLDIEVLTPDEAPYIIESSLELSKEGDNRYKAQLNALPQDEFTFTLYKNKEVTLMDRVQKKVDKMSYMLYFLWPFIAVVLALILIVIIRLVIRRRRNSKHL